MAQEQAKLKKRLEALLKLPENQTCVDCRKRGLKNSIFIKIYSVVCVVFNKIYCCYSSKMGFCKFRCIFLH